MCYASFLMIKGPITIYFALFKLKGLSVPGVLIWINYFHFYKEA